MGVHSLFSQKKGAVFSFILLAAVALLVVGILSVTAAHSKTVTLTPAFAAGGANQSYNFTITLGAGSATINEIRITKPADFSAFFCLTTPPVGGWSCATNGTTAAQTFVEFTGGTLAAGATMGINITATTSTNGINHTFLVRTQGNGEAANTTNINTTVDTTPPFIVLMNVSDGTNVLGPDSINGMLSLKNASGGLIIIVNATDLETTGNASGMGDRGRVTLYYNLSTLGENYFAIPDHRFNGTNVSSIQASSGNFGPSTLFNISLPVGDVTLLNGSRITFTLLANDTVGNGNLSNATVINSSYSYNFTIDAAAPFACHFYILNTNNP